MRMAQQRLVGRQVAAARAPPCIRSRRCCQRAAPCIRRLRVLAAVAGAAPAAADSTATAAPAPIKVPKSIHEVDNGKLLGFGADLSEDHPGFHDEEYKQRRMMIANIARDHEVGDPIPRVQYTPEEVKVWGTVLRELKALFPTHACKEYLRSYPLFNFRDDEIPQLQDISETLKATTGWQVRPVAGLLHPRDFLNGLAFKYFHSTQYVRHFSKPMYTPEPDVCHELIGHVPMLADPVFSDMVTAIGRASLGADDKQIWHLTKVYWYTVEFGVVRENGDIKAFGAGVLSSYGELEHMKQGGVEMPSLNPYEKQPKMSYKDGYQTRYFVLDSFEAGARLLSDYAATHAALPESLRGNPTMA